MDHFDLEVSRIYDEAEAEYYGNIPSIRKMWTILVPCERNDGRPIYTRFHRVWDEKVRKITGGLTIMPPSKGQWVSPNGEVYDERMIPVMFAATEEQCDEIMKLTLDYYEQLAVLCWEVSSNVKLLENKG